MYNASETSECYLILANDDGELWFISNRHVRAAGLFDGDALSLPRDVLQRGRAESDESAATADHAPAVIHDRPLATNGVFRVSRVEV